VKLRKDVETEKKGIDLKKAREAAEGNTELRGKYELIMGRADQFLIGDFQAKAIT